MLYTTTYEVGAPLHQTLYAVWEPAEATFNVEHYRVVAIRNADGTISQVLRVEDGPIYTTTQTGFKAEQLIAEGAVREITDYAAYPSLKGFEYFEDFSQLLNGTLYEEFDTITSAPGLAGDGTTTATVLAQALVTEGMKNVTAGANPMDIKRGMQKAVKAAVGSTGRCPATAWQPACSTSTARA